MVSSISRLPRPSGGSGLLLPASSLLALALARHIHNLHDARELHASEIAEAHSTLDSLDGRRGSNHSISPQANDVRRRHLSNLATHGVTVLRSVLTVDEAGRWDAVVSGQLRLEGACVVSPGGARGRRHCAVVRRKPGEEGGGGDLFEALERVAAGRAVGGLRAEGLRRASPSAATGEETSEGDGTETTTLNDIAGVYFASHGVGEGRYHLTQTQLLDAEPGSKNQIWHRDNVKPGLTAIVALREVGSNGPTELLMGSHRSSCDTLAGSNSRSDAVATSASDGGREERVPRILLAALRAGDAIVYDARVLHRGRGFGADRNRGEHRPVLVLRWDAYATPAPGTGLVGTQMAIWLGGFLAAVAGLMDKFVP